MHHTLKITPHAYEAVASGAKRFEVRRDDRMFQCGDRVSLVYFEESPFPKPPSDKPPLKFNIGFVLRGGQFGIEPGYVVFQLEPVFDEIQSTAAAMLNMRRKESD